MEALVERFLIEKDLASKPADYITAVPKLELAADEVSAEDLLELGELTKVAGVNALTQGQSLAFHSNLTVLYGENGAGKTGYSRVLKRLAAVRTAEDILPNAHAAGRSAPPTASVSTL